MYPGSLLIEMEQSAREMPENGDNGCYVVRYRYTYAYRLLGSGFINTACNLHGVSVPQCYRTCFLHRVIKNLMDPMHCHCKMKMISRRPCVALCRETIFLRK